MVTYKVDLDYEASLFDPHYNEDSRTSKKMIREFEYVFFLVEDSSYTLKNYKHYDSQYLTRLKKMGFTLPEFEPTAIICKNWWSHDHDHELEKILNSKLTSAQMASQQGWGFKDGTIIQNIGEVENHLSKYPTKTKWMLKDPFSFSGKGHYLFDKENLNMVQVQKISHKMLLEPVYDRVFDIGTTFVIQNGTIEKQFMVENFISKTGGFRGGAGSCDVGNFKKYIEKKYSYSLDELESLTEKIAKEYLQLGAQNNVQIDSFIYQENGKKNLYALVEVNYRKTMGLVIQCLAQKFNSSDIINWSFSPHKREESQTVIRLSPDDSHFHSYLELQ